jgi:hypothetical protein
MVLLMRCLVLTLLRVNSLGGRTVTVERAATYSR